MVALGLLLGCAVGCTDAERHWERAAAESVGLLAPEFERWANAVHERDTDALLVLRNGRLIHEWYARGSGAHAPEHLASVAKGVVGGLALAALAAEGSIDLDAPVARNLNVWGDDPQKARITARQLASHSSGLANADSGLHDARPRDAWEKKFWQLGTPPGPAQVALHEVPLAFEPGAALGYSNPGFAVLSVAIAAALQDGQHGSLPEWLRQRVLEPIGVPAAAWSVGYGRAFDVAGVEAWMTFGGAKFSPDALARLGSLLLRRGDWQGTRVLPAAAVDSLLTPAGSPDARGWPSAALGWWSNANAVWPRLPRDAVLAIGVGQKLLLIVPSLDLVVVRLGGALEPDAAWDDYWGPLERALLDPLMDAFPAPPVPRSDAIVGAWFAPLSSVECRAAGSDNWPITALPSGALFTAYGDGWGFEPKVAEKLSLGLARLEDGPADFVATNVRSATGERSGEGPSGGKASGLLALDDTLYMWVRNLENSQLAWSSDAGANWEWGFRFRESFGSPTFLNFGPGLRGARDAFVYVYSQDGPSAYESDDGVVLARVPRERIRERGAYEFYAGSDAHGSPRWSAQIGERIATFVYPGASRRGEVIFNADLGRYLLALGFDAEGGWGLFEAAEPWGPWRTVYFTSRWDAGQAHSYRLPTTWISNGGRDLNIVYSGVNRGDQTLDAFCVRRLGLTLGRDFERDRRAAN